MTKGWTLTSLLGVGAVRATPGAVLAHTGAGASGGLAAV